MTHSVLCHVEGDLDVRLSGEIVDFGRLHRRNDVNQVGSIGQICVIPSSVEAQGDWSTENERLTPIMQNHIGTYRAKGLSDGAEIRQGDTYARGHPCRDARYDPC